jgi:hypothetical protein
VERVLVEFRQNGGKKGAETHGVTISALNSARALGESVFAGDESQRPGLLSCPLEAGGGQWRSRVLLGGRDADLAGEVAEVLDAID